MDTCSSNNYKSVLQGIIIKKCQNLIYQMLLVFISKHELYISKNTGHAQFANTCTVIHFFLFHNISDVPISEFTQSDLASNSVIYIHTSTEETYMDSFTFSVSDGPHDVVRTLSISISPVDDSIPVVVNNGLKVQEGVRKLITEFDLKATDKDTKVFINLYVFAEVLFLEFQKCKAV